MSRIRKVYKKEDTFEAIFKDEFISSLNKSGKKDKNNIANDDKNKQFITNEAMEKLNQIDVRIENNFKKLNIQNKPSELKKNEQECVYDENFILENNIPINKNEDYESVCENIYENLYENELEEEKVQKLNNFIEENKESQQYENKKRTFNEAFKEDSNNKLHDKDSGKKNKLD